MSPVPATGDNVDVTEVLLGMAACLALAVLVLSLVAIPRVRAGSKVLTTEGEESLRDAQRRARALAAQARRAGGSAGRAVAGAADVRERVVARSERGAASGPAPVATPVVAGVGVGAGTSGRASQGAGAPEGIAPGATSPGFPGESRTPVAEQSPGAPASAPEPGPGAGTVTGLTEAAPEPEVDVAALDRDLEARVVDLREGVSAHERAVEHRVEQRLTWGEPRPGPRHGRR